MKATLEIPDALYRQVKARSAMEGRPLRAIAIDLFQNWLAAPAASSPAHAPLSDEELARSPWLAISQKYVKPGMSHDMESIRTAIATGWAQESAESTLP